MNAEPRIRQPSDYLGVRLLPNETQDTATSVVSAPSIEALPTYNVGDDDTFIGAPWQIGGWRWATNGHLLIAERLREGETAAPVPARFQVAGDRFIEPPLPEPVLTADFSALRQAAGDVFVPHTTTCRSCEGRGRDQNIVSPCEHCERPTSPHCYDCEGTGKVKGYMPERPIRIAGVPVNFTYLAYGLAAVSRMTTPLMGSIAPQTFDLHDFLIYVAIHISEHPWWTVTVGDLFIVLLAYGALRALGWIPERPSVPPSFGPVLSDRQIEDVHRAVSRTKGAA